MRRGALRQRKTKFFFFFIFIIFIFFFVYAFSTHGALIVSVLSVFFFLHRMCVCVRWVGGWVRCGAPG